MRFVLHRNPKLQAADFHGILSPQYERTAHLGGVPRDQPDFSVLNLTRPGLTTQLLDCLIQVVHGPEVALRQLTTVRVNR